MRLKANLHFTNLNDQSTKKYIGIATLCLCAIDLGNVAWFSLWILFFG